MTAIARHVPASRGRGLVLIGYRGTGKSTVGRILADRLGRPFLDADREIEARAGRSIRVDLRPSGASRCSATGKSSTLAELTAEEPGASSPPAAGRCSARPTGAAPRLRIRRLADGRARRAGPPPGSRRRRTRRAARPDRRPGRSTRSPRSSTAAHPSTRELADAVIETDGKDPRRGGRSDPRTAGPLNLDRTAPRASPSPHDRSLAHVRHLADARSPSAWDSS